MTDSPLPVAVPRPRREACGDVVEQRGDALLIKAALPIEGLAAASRYRKPVLVYDDARWVLQSIGGDARRPTYSLTREDPNLYEPSGDVVYYDGQRHHERRQQRRRFALSWLLWIPSVPLMPLIGLLPQEWKQRLGVDAGRATRLSLNIEWLLLLPCVLAYFFLGGFWTPAGLIDGALCLLLASDIAYRVTADAQGEAPGMFSIVGELRKFVVGMIRTARGKDRLLDDAGNPIDRPPP